VVAQVPDNQRKSRSRAARAWTFVAASGLAFVVSGCAVVAAHLANPPYMGDGRAVPAHDPGGTVWAALAYLVWLLPAGVALWAWRRIGVGVIVAVLLFGWLWVAWWTQLSAPVA
jgi:hypothetical protein